MIPKLYCRTRSPGECAPAISSRHDSPAATTVRTLPLLPAPDPCCPAVVHTHAPSSGSMLSYCGPHPCSQLWIHAARLWSTPMLPAPDPCCPAVVHTHRMETGTPGLLPSLLLAAERTEAQPLLPLCFLTPVHHPRGAGIVCGILAAKKSGRTARRLEGDWLSKP